VLQLRPTTANRVSQAFYAPNRDLGHIGVAYLRAAVALLEPETFEPWFQVFVQKNGITDEQLGMCASCLGAATSLIAEHADVRDALQAAGFYDLPQQVQLAMYIRLGQVLLGGVWTSVRELTMAGQEPACSVQEVFDDLGRQLQRTTLWQRVWQLIGRWFS
jgi:hypothetical protein